LSYYSGNTVVSWASTTITDSHQLTTGREVFVTHYDHGMYSNTNKIKVSNVQPDVTSTTLNATLSLSDSTLEVASGAALTSFEGLPVDGTNIGYLKVGNEIIGYNNVNGSEITIATNGRGIDGTQAQNHDIGSIVQKYEFNGVSLRRINGVTSSIKGPIGIDGYYFDIDTGNTNGLDRTNDTLTRQSLAFNGNNSGGGNNVYAQENILYTGVRPTYDIQTPSADTFVNGRIRTVSGTSVGASANNPQESFLDKGYQTIQLNTFNFLPDPRMICSEVNQDEYLTNLPRNKSFTTAINFNTSDKNVSPILNLNTAFTEFFSSRLNNPVSDFTTDNRVNSIYEDPHSAVYYSKSVSLANPATSLKVILSAYRHESADIRVLYSLTRADSSEVEQKFELFPGYENLRSGQSGLEVIDSAKNTGHSDINVPSSLENEFLEYEYNANGLGLFTGFTIKIIMSGENQAQPPRLSDLRVIAIR
jgi:hypothetical protein